MLKSVCMQEPKTPYNYDSEGDEELGHRDTERVRRVSLTDNPMRKLDPEKVRQKYVL